MSVPLTPEEREAQSVSIPESVPLMKHTLVLLRRFPALSPVSVDPMVELPCCGLRVDFEAIECSQDGPSRVFWPPRWTCPECHRTFTPNHDESALDELEASRPYPAAQRAGEGEGTGCPECGRERPDWHAADPGYDAPDCPSCLTGQAPIEALSAQRAGEPTPNEVERAAKAIYDGDCDGDSGEIPWGELHPNSSARAYYVELARAALAARQPDRKDT